MVIRKPVDLPPAVARAFVRDMQAYFSEENQQQARPDRGAPLHALKQYQGPREKPLPLSDVKAMFQQMGDQV